MEWKKNEKVNRYKISPSQFKGKSDMGKMPFCAGK